MADFGFSFDASTVEPAVPRTHDVLPPGRYPAQVIESEVKATNAGTGQYLSLTLEVVDGPHAGRKLWDIINLINPSETAQRIGREQLSALCHAVGVTLASNSDPLHFKPLLVTVHVLPAGVDRKGYERKTPKNEVKGYEPLPRAGAAPARTAPQPAAAVVAAQAAKPAGNTRPWAPKSAG